MIAPSLLTMRVTTTRAANEALEYWISGARDLTEASERKRPLSCATRFCHAASSSLRACGVASETMGFSRLRSSALRRGFDLLEGGLFLRVGSQSVFVGLVGGGPEGRAEGDGIVIEGGELDGSVATAARAVGFVVADEDGDAGDAGAIASGALRGAEGGAGFKGVDVFDAVLDEEGFLEAGELELGCAAV